MNANFSSFPSSRPDRPWHVHHAARHCLALALVSGLWGCSTNPKIPLHEVDTQNKAGSTYVAVTYVEPWKKVAPALKPGFSMPSGETALSKVIPQTSIALNRLLNVTNVGLGAGFSGTATPGEAPTPDQTPPANSSAKDIGGTDVTGKDIAQEPMLQYSTALALFQEVQLLNRYVDGIPTREGYVPYLVRLQITLIPYARHEPYDGYSNISFFLRYQNKTPTQLPYVIPLVATDSMEGTLTSSTNETVRQFAIALSGVVQNAQARAALQHFADELHSTTGTDLNSLQTIGRSSDNSIQVRFGAPKSPIGSNAYAMVPRTHNVTLLLLAPKDWVATDSRVIQITSQTQFYHAISGKRLVPITPEEINAELSELIPYYLQDSHLKKNQQIYMLARLLSLVGDNDYRGFVQEMKTQKLDLSNHMYLWNSLSVIANSYGLAGTSFELPRPAQTALPPTSQTALLLDDGNSASTTHLIGGSQLSPDDMFATLDVENKNAAQLQLAALSISASGNDLTLAFPSLARLGIPAGNDTKKKIHLTEGSGKEQKEATYPVYTAMITAPKTSPGFQLETAVTGIPVKTGNTGQISLYLTFVQSGADKIAISTQGGEIQSATFPSGQAHAGYAIAMSGGVVTVTGKAGGRVEVILGLDNVLGGNTLKISASGYKANKKTSTSSLDVSLQQAGKPDAK